MACCGTPLAGASIRPGTSTTEDPCSTATVAITATTAGAMPNSTELEGRSTEKVWAAVVSTAAAAAFMEAVAEASLTVRDN
jgi:hypothetical protein